MFTAVSGDRKPRAEPGSAQGGASVPPPPRQVGSSSWMSSSPASPDPHTSNASPCLSPVSTQILMLASVRIAMVSGTPCCSLSSMAVAPSSWRTQTGQQGLSLQPPPAPQRPQPTYHHIVFHLVVEPSQAILTGLGSTAGSVQPLGPVLIVALLQIFVGQHQRPQPLASVLLQAAGAGRTGRPQLCSQTLITPQDRAQARFRASGQPLFLSQPCPQDPAPLTLRWSVVTLVRSWLMGCRRSSRMVSAPLQYSRILPPGLRTVGSRGQAAWLRGTGASPTPTPSHDPTMPPQSHHHLRGRWSPAHCTEPPHPSPTATLPDPLQPSQPHSSPPSPTAPVSCPGPHR